MGTFVIGIDRDATCPGVRRVNPGSRRTFWIGGIHIQSGKRFPVDLEWLRHNYADVIAQMRVGMLRVEHADIQAIDPEVLAGLCGLDGNESAPVTPAPVEPVLVAEPPVVQQEPEPETGTEAVVDEPLELEPEPAVEPGGEEEPVLEEPDPGEEDAPELPQNWRTLSKKGLLEVCAGLGIDTSDMPSNRVLIERIEARVL